MAGRRPSSVKQRAAPPRARDYNYEHFHPGLLLEDAKLTLRPDGPGPGDMAPDFGLEDTSGRAWRVSALRGRPVVLIFGSGS